MGFLASKDNVQHQHTSSHNNKGNALQVGNPRSQLIPGAEQHIVMEEEITEITQSSTVPVTSNEPQSFHGIPFF